LGCSGKSIEIFPGILSIESRSQVARVIHEIEAELVRSHCDRGDVELKIYLQMEANSPSRVSDSAMNLDTAVISETVSAFTALNSYMRMTCVKSILHTVIIQGLSNV
jgi:hypothetical protein